MVWGQNGWCTGLQIDWSGVKTGQGHSVVLLGNTILDNSASLHPLIHFGAGELVAQPDWGEGGG